MVLVNPLRLLFLSRQYACQTGGPFAEGNAFAIEEVIFQTDLRHQFASREKQPPDDVA